MNDMLHRGVRKARWTESIRRQWALDCAGQSLHLLGGGSLQRSLWQMAAGKAIQIRLYFCVCRLAGHASATKRAPLPLALRPFLFPYPLTWSNVFLTKVALEGKRSVDIQRSKEQIACRP